MDYSKKEKDNLTLDDCIFLLSKKQRDDTCPYVVLTKEQVSFIKSYLLDYKLEQYQKESKEMIHLNKRQSRFVSIMSFPKSQERRKQILLEALKDAYQLDDAPSWRDALYDIRWKE